MKVIEREVATSEPNGTTVIVGDVHLKAFDQPGIIRYVERHLAHARRDATVIINNHECEYTEPPINRSVTASAQARYGPSLANVELTLHVAKAPLESDLRGVAIYSNGVWHATTLAGAEGRDMSQYIFGEIDVPALDTDASPISPYDMGRSMELNPSNALVQAIYAFTGENVERLRKELVEADKSRRRTEEARKLAEQGSKIAELLNDDFEQFRDKFKRVRAKGRGSADILAGDVLSVGSEFLFPQEDDEPAKESEVGVRVRGTGPIINPSDVIRPNTKLLEADQSGSERGGAASGIKQKGSARSGGFSVDFKELGEASARAKYDSEVRTIYINLDHPQIAAARLSIGNDLEEPSFKRLTYEVAFSEYAIAIAQELANEGQYVDLTDPNC